MLSGNEYDGAPVVIMDIVPNIRGLGSQRRTALRQSLKKKKKKKSAVCLAYKHSDAENRSSYDFPLLCPPLLDFD